MIDERKLIEILNELGNGKDASATFTSLDHIAEMVKSMCAVCGWVDAKKTLPEDGQEVLVTEDYEGKRAVKKATYYRMSPYWNKHVVAWMALPEAYDG